MRYRGWGFLIRNLERYGDVPRLCKLLGKFWVHQKVVPRLNFYHGPSFPDTWGTMQDSLVSPTLFNVVIDYFIRTWLDLTVEYQRSSIDGVG